MPNFLLQCGFYSRNCGFYRKQDACRKRRLCKGVYVYAFFLAVNGKSEGEQRCCKKLNLLESDVVNAVEYWRENGALRFENDSVIFRNADVPVAAVEPVPEHSPKKDISELLTENKALADLCILAQEILGKTLNSRETETLFWFYDNLGLSAEVISMLLEYCVSKGKRNMAYIEKVAISWHENGLTTMNAVENFISDEQEKKTYVYELRKLF